MFFFTIISYNIISYSVVLFYNAIKISIWADYAAGGALKYGESYKEAALRELKEETEINSVEIKHLIDFNWRSKTLNYNAKVFYCIWDGKINIQKEEIEKGFFVSLKEFEKMLKTEKFCPDMVEAWKKHGNKIKNETIKISRNL